MDLQSVKANRMCINRWEFILKMLHIRLCKQEIQYLQHRGKPQPMPDSHQLLEVLLPDQSHLG